MTDRSPQPASTCQPYGAVRSEGDTVAVDVTDAALARMVRLLGQHPWLVRTLALASATAPSDPGIRRRAVTVLRGDPDVRDACTVHLSIEDAVQLATEIIAAASPSPAPARARVSVGGRGKNETTDHARKDAR